MNQILTDYDAMIAWGRAATQAYIEGGYKEDSIRKWQYHIEKLLRSMGGVTGQLERGPKAFSCHRVVIHDQRADRGHAGDAAPFAFGEVPWLLG